jgi:hypothetical protein
VDVGDDDAKRDETQADLLVDESPGEVERMKELCRGVSARENDSEERTISDDGR